MKSTYEEVKGYLKKAHELKNKARALKRQMPKRLGEYILSVTRQPMRDKNGKQITYTDKKTGEIHKRYRNLHDVQEFKNKYKIIRKTSHEDNNKLVNNNQPFSNDNHAEYNVNNRRL